MDLSNKPTEITSQKYYADTLIKKQYDENRIPIFIHSGNLQHYEGYKDEGTVYRIEKSGDSASKICSTIKLMHKSQFLNIFCRNGLLEQKIMSEIHASFTKQYKGDEIENIIKSIEAVNSENLSDRVIEVFQRMAIRSLFYNLTETKSSNDNSVEEIKLNSIEHYYRRNNEAIKFWTGDIFKSRAENHFCVILTPRCNLGHLNFEELLCCKIMDFSTQHFEAFDSQKKGVTAFRKSITDDVTNPLVGEIFRFLPPTPQFSGGLVDFRKLFTVTLNEFEESYENSPFISLSEELTNDIVRKFTGYLQRGGISETEINEAYYYYQQLKSQKV